MKIAIMTQPLGHNYGGIMQAYALQQVLKRMGHDPVTIDRPWDNRDDKRSLIYKAARLGYRAVMQVLGRRKFSVSPEQLPYVLKNTYSFMAQNIVMSERLDSTAKLKNNFLKNRYDAVIVGSDQTWRPKYSPNIYNYYLDFAQDINLRKIAYASSFGVDNWEYTTRQTKVCSELAKNFHTISTRECSGTTLCATHLGVQSAHVLDPTLLLKAEDYLSAFDLPTSASSKNVFAYILDADIEKSQCVQDVVGKIGGVVFHHQPKVSLGSVKKHSLEDYYFPSVEGWVEAFSKSSFVITDSFHGCVFSILFNKPFLAISNEERGSARFDSLLELFGLQDRVVTSREAAHKVLQNEIDWMSVNATLQSERAKSLKFLSAALGNPGLK